MEFTLHWWYWLVFGMILVAVEMIVPSFTLFWFGLAAGFVALLMFFLPEISLSIQLSVWALSSIGFTIAWFKFFKPTMVDRTKAGISKEAVTGETGIVTKVPQADIRGIVRFSMPLLGADEWEFICHEECQVGDRVEIIDVSGNTLVVRPKGN
ncbi:MAG: NfeD family protein [Desulfobulbaceae bacterium]|nr:MAG: NfeD family protein [Desulfobulbaceae bacterium]